MRTLLDTSASRCASSTITTVGDLRIADGGRDRRLVLDRRRGGSPTATSTAPFACVPARLPGLLSALAAPGDGSVLFIARDDGRDDAGDALWRLPDAVAALAGPPTC